LPDAAICSFGLSKPNVVHTNLKENPVPDITIEGKDAKAASIDNEIQ
jgi:hypothetical protein